MLVDLSEYPLSYGTISIKIPTSMRMPGALDMVPLAVMQVAVSRHSPMVAWRLNLEMKLAVMVMKRGALNSYLKINT